MSPTSATNTATVAQSANPADTQDEPMKTYPMLSFRCDSKLLKALQRQAKQQNISIGELIREACTNHLERIKETSDE